VPNSVKVAAGKTTASFSVTTTTAGVKATATITGKLGSTSKTATLTINPLTVVSVHMTSSSLTSGGSTNGLVTLNASAPTGGIVVTLASNETAANVPSQVTVAAGASTGSFTIKAGTVTEEVQAKITATLDKTSASSTVTVLPKETLALTLSPASLTGGQTSTATLTLGTKAPAGGLVFQATSSSTAATVGATVTVPAGKTSATFSIQSWAVSATTPASITVTLGQQSEPATLTVNQAVLATVSLNPSSILGGNSTTGTVTLSGPAPAEGSVVKLSSTQAVATVPVSVTVLSGQTQAIFPVETTAVTANTTAMIGATFSGVARTTPLVINAPATVSLLSFGVYPTSIFGGNPVTGTVTLTGAAPSGGLVVKLASNSTNASLPATVTVPAGQTYVTFTVTTKVVPADTSAQLTATLGSVSKTITLGITW